MPKLNKVIDPKPKMQAALVETKVFSDSFVITPGMPYGLLLTLTRPDSQSGTMTRV